MVLLCVCAAAGLALSGTFALTCSTIRGKEEAKKIRAVVTAFWNVELTDGARWQASEIAKVTEDGAVLRKADVGAEEFAEIEGAVIYEGRDPVTNELVGYATQGAAAGYSSTIRLMVGAKPLGKGRYRILGVKVLSQQETPGLGARMNDVFTTDTLWTVLGAALTDRERRGPAPTEDQKTAAGKLNVPIESIQVRAPFQAQFAGKVVAVTDGKVGGLELSKTGWAELVAGNPPEGDTTVAAMTGATISSKGAVDAVYDAVRKIHKATTPANERE